MTQHKSLSSLFRELGNNPRQLAAFQADPGRFLDELAKEEKEKLLKIGGHLNVTHPLLKLPDDEPITPGSFYVGTDEGSTIYQLYNTNLDPGLGKIALSGSVPSSDKLHLEVERNGTNKTQQLFKLKETQNDIVAIQHFEDPDQPWTCDTYHTVTIRQMTFGIDKEPRGPYITKVGDISFNPDNLKLFLKLAVSDSTKIEVSGNVRGPSKLSVTSEYLPYDIRCDAKQGRILLKAPGSYHTINFGPGSSTISA